MPHKPNKPCAWPGCPNLTKAGETYCPEHMKMANQNYERYGRDPETKRRYKSRHWRIARSIKLKQCPYCQECYRSGVMTPAEVVHHIVPLSEGGTHDQSNLMSLCKSCHSRIHAERGDRWGK